MEIFHNTTNDFTHFSKKNQYKYFLKSAAHVNWLKLQENTEELFVATDRFRDAFQFCNNLLN